MKKRILFLLSALLILGGCTPQKAPEDSTAVPAVTTEEIKVDGRNITIHSIEEFNKSSETDSHAAETGGSSVELDFRTSTTLKSAVLKTGTAYYPRLKKLADGSYILFYNDGQTGPNIYYVTSTDLVKWSEPTLFFASHATADGDTILYATCDMTTAANGDIIAAACYRSQKFYKTDPSKSGLVKRISKDGGKTWSAEEIIYVGTAWEPGLLTLASGEVHIYFTQIAPYMHFYGYKESIRSSGSALLRSSDNGETFTPNITGAPYEAYRVMQSYVGDLDGLKIFNDQMPVAIETHGGTIVLTCETKRIDGKFRLSIGYSADNWAHELAIDEAGPSDKSTQAFSGAGPYIMQFDSGETLLSYAAENTINMKVGNAEGRKFSAVAAQPFKSILANGTTLWSCLEREDSHTALAATEYILTTAGTGSKISMLTYGKLRLNHRINAPVAGITVDGDNADWNGVSDALFVGSESQAQVSLRAAHDDKNLYLLAEVLDGDVTDGDGVVVFVKGNDTYYKLDAKPNGDFTVQKFTGMKYENVDSGATTANFVGTDGYICEFSLDKGVFGIGDSTAVNLVLKNKDGTKRSENDTFDGASLTDTNTWKSVILDK